MKSKTVIIIIGAAVIGIELMIISQNYFNARNLPPQAEVKNPAPAKINKWETKIDEQGNVAVEVTPQGLEPQSSEWKFSVVMETHTVELDQDMTGIAVLIDDKGTEYKPLNWEGAPPGGHHRSGALLFKAISPLPKTIELKISGIDGAVRSFIWQL